MNKLQLLIKLPFTIFCLFLCISGAFSQELLDNQTIITLSKKGLGNSIIINKIKSSKSAFNVTTDGLINLKDNLVSDQIIEAMIEASNLAGTSSGDPKVDAIVSKLYESGIYYFNESTQTYIKIDPTVVSGSKVGAGLTSVKSTSIIDGAKANTETTSSPVIYFYFGKPNESKLGSTSNVQKSNNDLVNMLQSYAPSKSNEAFSPNDFKLLELKTSKNSRSYESGKISAFGGISSGVSKNVEVFKYERLSQTLYKVYFNTPLKPGQYCFMYATSASSGGVATGYMGAMGAANDVKVFDFGVK